MFLLAFHAFLRLGDIINTENSTFVLQFASIQFGQISENKPQDLILSLSNVKHHQEKPPVDLHLTATKDNNDVCPISAMWEYCKMSGKANGPLFMFQDITPISRHMFSNQLQISLTLLGYDTKFTRATHFTLAQPLGKILGVFLMIKYKYVVDENLMHTINIFVSPF
jgi:hypothetical protein